MTGTAWGSFGSTVASAEGSWFEVGLARRPFCVEFDSSPCAAIGSLQVLHSPPQSKDMHSLIRNGKLSECVCISVC